MSRRCVFLDRDGVINVKQPDGQYVCGWDQFDWIPKRRSTGFDCSMRSDYLVIVVTNQRAVAKGLLTMAALDEIHRRMTEELARRDARIDDVMVCPHEIDACDCRKPRPGMVHAACDKWHIDLAHSLMVGDSESDRQLAMNCGLRFVRRAGRKDHAGAIAAFQRNRRSKCPPLSDCWS